MSTGKFFGLTLALLLFTGNLLADEINMVPAVTLIDAQTSLNHNLTAKAEAQFLQLLHSPEDKKSALYSLSMIALHSENLSLAREYLTQAQAILPITAEESVLAGNILCLEAQQTSIFKALGLAKKCAAAYEQASIKFPSNPYALSAAIGFYLGAPALAGGSVSKAEEKLLQLKKIAPERAVGLKASGLMTQKKEAQALALLDQLNQAELQTIFGAYTSARIYRDNKEYRKAIQALTRLHTLVLLPTAPYEDHWMFRDAYLQHGELLMLEKQPLVQAIALLERYQEQSSNPNDIHYFWGLWSLAKAYQANNELEKYQQQVAQITAQDYQKNKDFAREFDAALKANTR